MAPGHAASYRDRMTSPRRSTRPLLPALVLLLLAIAGPPQGVRAQDSAATSDPFPSGRSLSEVDVDGTTLQLFTYKASNYSGEGFILLLHGASRAAEAYRDNAAGMAERYHTMVVVPYFDLERFPNRLYQMGGVFDEDGSFVDPAEQTYAYVPKVVAHIRGREGNAALPYEILGFSAGAQFVSRMAAFYDLDAERLLVMSPGSVIFPTRDLDFELGFGRLPDEYATDERLKRYLALPITVSVGTRDTELAQLPTGDAYAQGVHRYSRALHWFTYAMDLAYEKGWDFNWRLVVFDGPGHSPPQMFNHDQIGNALYGHRPGGTPR